MTAIAELPRTVPRKSPYRLGTGSPRTVAPTRLFGHTRFGRALATLTPREWLQYALGLIWLLDAALQFQPFMFTRGFVTQVIGPAAAGNPAALREAMSWAATLLTQYIAVFNAIFAGTQLLIAIGIFLPRTRRAALAGSIAYSLSVWFFGEGLGGVLSGASPFEGAPGAVMLYALIALLIWPTRDAGSGAPTSPAVLGKLGERGALVAWAMLWGSLSYYFLLPANRAPHALAALLSASASGEPGWLRATDSWMAHAVGGRGTVASLALAALSLAVALGASSKKLRKITLLVSSALALLIWLGEAFGGIFTGTGTDPNTGLLLVLMAASYWPYKTHGVTENGAMESGATDRPLTRLPLRHDNSAEAHVLHLRATR